MSTSTIVSKGDGKTGDRRGRTRETLQCVVLVYYGNENWGKLIEMNEGGMSFQFAQLPPLRQRISFTFQVMGCMPMPRAGVFGESFEATGEILWTHAFERIAGVRFLDLPETSRQQIRRWVSFGKPVEEPIPVREIGEKDEVQEAQIEKAPRVAAEPSESSTSYSEILTEIDVMETLARLKERRRIAEPAYEPEPAFPAEGVAGTETQKSIAEQPPEPEPQFTGEDLAERRREESAAAPYEEQREPEPTVGSDHSVARAALVFLTVSLAAIAVFVGARMLLLRWGPGAQAVEGTPAVAAARERSGAVNRLSGQSPQPFQVEVLDTNGKRWLLWFVRNTSSSGVNPIASKSAAPSRSTTPTVGKNTAPMESAPSEKTEAGREFTLAAPKIGQPRGNAPVPSAEAPMLSAEVSASFMEPMESVPASPKAPALAPQPPRVGGDVQQARLIQSVPPAYPELAKTARIGGEVIMDAVIDSAGNVTGVKVISGPPMLQEAAVAALRQWKYEPARLDGQPVSMNLRVALRFRLR